MASRREWVGLAVIALPCLLYSMDLRLFRAPAVSASLTAFLQPRVMIQDPPQQPRQVIALIRRE